MIVDLIRMLMQRTFFQRWIPLLFYKPYPHYQLRIGLMIAETALKFIWQEQQSLTPMQQKIQLMLAAITAISDYQPDSDLLTFSALDGEDFLQD